MIEAASIDLTGLDNMIGGLRNALVGTGQQGDLHELLKNEARALALEISGQLGPRTAKGGKKKIIRDLKKVFHPMMVTETQVPWKTFKGSQAEGEGTRWLYAGPTFLVGVKNEDYQPDGANMGEIFNAAGRNKADRGNAWQDQGERINGVFTTAHKYKASRGRQHVMMLNRIAVKKAPFMRLVKQLQDRVGRMRATFAFAAFKLGATSVPQWVSKHFGAVQVDGSAIFDASKLEDKESPSIAFGSRAPGITQLFFAGKIQNSITSREKIVADKLQKILSGYAYNWNTGAVFKEK